jgi:hypothetical protein
MPDDFTFNPVDDFFGDVGGMIGHALDIALNFCLHVVFKLSCCGGVERARS